MFEANIPLNYSWFINERYNCELMDNFINVHMFKLYIYECTQKDNRKIEKLYAAGTKNVFLFFNNEQRNNLPNQLKDSEFSSFSRKTST